MSTMAHPKFTLILTYDPATDQGNLITVDPSVPLNAADVARALLVLRDSVIIKLYKPSEQEPPREAA